MSGQRCHLNAQEFERTLDLPNGIDCHTSIARGGSDVPMAQQILDHVNIDAVFQEMSGEAVAQGVYGDGFV